MQRVTFCNDILTVIMLNVDMPIVTIFYTYSECQYAECHYSETTLLYA
jgi:hypothetical protein